MGGALNGLRHIAYRPIVAYLPRFAFSSNSAPLFFEHDVITRVELADGRYNPLQADKTYIVLAP